MADQLVSSLDTEKQLCGLFLKQAILPELLFLFCRVSFDPSDFLLCSCWCECHAVIFPCLTLNCLQASSPSHSSELTSTQLTQEVQAPKSIFALEDIGKINTLENKISRRNWRGGTEQELVVLGSLIFRKGLLMCR